MKGTEDEPLRLGSLGQALETLTSRLAACSSQSERKLIHIADKNNGLGSNEFGLFNLQKLLEQQYPLILTLVGSRELPFRED